MCGAAPDQARQRVGRDAHRLVVRLAARVDQRLGLLAAERDRVDQDVDAAELLAHRVDRPLIE